MRIDLTIPTKLLGRVEISIHITLPSLLRGWERARARVRGGYEKALVPASSQPDDATPAP